MMMSKESYFDKIKGYSYENLLLEERKLFKNIIELQFKIVLEDIHLPDEFISPSYQIQLEYNREYLIVLENYILEKERAKQKEELENMIRDARRNKNIKIK